MSSKGDRLVRAVTAWAQVNGDCDTPEWRVWDRVWKHSSNDERRAALVTIALQLVAVAS